MTSNSGYSVGLNYIQVPVNFQYKIDLSGPKLLVQAGPYLGYGLGGKTKVMDIENSIKMGSDEAFKAIDYGVVGGVGVQFGQIQIGAGYQLGLANIANTFQGLRNEKSIKNTGLNFSLTYLF